MAASSCGQPILHIPRVERACQLRPLLARELNAVEPARGERAEGATQPISAVNEPCLTPQVDQAVRRRRAGEVYPAVHVLVRHLGQRSSALTALPQAKRLQPGAFVGDHRAEWPAAAELFNQPHQVVVVGGEHAGVAVEQRSGTLFGSADDRLHFDVAQVLPFCGLVWPSAGRHAQRRQNERRLRLFTGAVECLQSAERTHRFAHPHASPDVRARHLEYVVDNEVLVGARGEYFSI